MGVISCKLSRSTPRLSIDAKWTRTYNHQWLIETNDPYMLPAAVYVGALSASPDPLPQHWSYYDFQTFGSGSGSGVEIDTGSFLQSLVIDKANQDEANKFFWKAVGVWSPPEPGTDKDNTPTQNPLSRAVQYGLDWAPYTEKVTRDIVDDRLIANSAGDLFEDIERENARPILVAVKNEWPLSGIIAKAIQFKNAMNNATFYGAPAHCAKMDSITVGPIQSENGYNYYPVTYRIQFTNVNEGTWDLVLENKGNMAYNIDKEDADAFKSRVIVLDGARKGEFRDWAYLAYDGTQLPDDEEPLPIPADADPDGPFKLYRPLDFSLLGIGTA